MSHPWSASIGLGTGVAIAVADNRNIAALSGLFDCVAVSAPLRDVTGCLCGHGNRRTPPAPRAAGQDSSRAQSASMSRFSSCELLADACRAIEICSRLPNGDPLHDKLAPTSGPPPSAPELTGVDTFLSEGIRNQFLSRFHVQVHSPLPAVLCSD